MGKDSRVVEPLHPERLTWAALLGRWVDFARSALALPDDAEGRRLRRCVPDMIMLQAVWCALRELDGLHPAERALGLDRAGVLIDRHVSAIEAAWEGEVLPAALLDLIGEAREQWNRVAQGDVTS